MTARVKRGVWAELRLGLGAVGCERGGLDEQRLKREQGINPRRDNINDRRLKAQAAELNMEQFRERLAELHLVTEADEAPFLDELNAGGADRLKDAVLQGDIARLNAEIEALGPVNLAALEELATASERKGFPDAQSADLAEAISDLSPKRRLEVAAALDLDDAPMATPDMPAALSGISASFILAMSRAIGETMIVAIAAGQQPRLTANPMNPVETMTAYIVQVSMGDTPAGSIAFRTIFAVGMLLFLMTFVLNLISDWLRRRFRVQYS